MFISINGLPVEDFCPHNHMYRFGYETQSQLHVVKNEINKQTRKKISYENNFSST